MEGEAHKGWSRPSHTPREHEAMPGQGSYVLTDEEAKQHVAKTIPSTVLGTRGCPGCSAGICSTLWPGQACRLRK